jgi:FdhE protein
VPPGETLSREQIAAGEVAKPPFAVLPDPRLRFMAQAERFKRLAPGHELEGYLRFLGTLSEAQHLCQDGLAEAVLPPKFDIETAYDHGMPPVSIGRFDPDSVASETLGGIVERLAQSEIPAESLLAVESIRAMPEEERARIMHGVLMSEFPPEELAQHVLAAAALQVHFARLAMQLEANRLTPVAPGACPACGGAPVASLVVAWPKVQGYRYCCCSLCGTKWNVPRITCVLCGSDKGIAYHGIEGGSDAIKAETCEECHGYLKIFHQHKDQMLDPVADDVASLGLDILLRGEGYRRGSANPFLLGY